MSRHLGLRAALGIVIVLAASLALAQDAQKDKKDVKDKAPDYYPLQAGNEWHYSATANGQTTKVVTRIAKVENLDGQLLARLESPNAKDTEHLFQNEKGVFRARLNGMEVTPPFQLIPYPAKPGMKWKGEFTVAGEKGTHTYTGEIQKEESIKVAAGKYETIRVYIKLEENGQQVETTYWFAKDVGFVKQTLDVAGASITLELEKFERKK
jgi:Protein of unknown function (DUF3108)